MCASLNWLVSKAPFRIALCGIRATGLWGVLSGSKREGFDFLGVDHIAGRHYRRLLTHVQFGSSLGHYSMTNRLR